MNLPQLTDSARLRLVQFAALVNQVMAGGSLADWQINRLVPADAEGDPAVAARLRMMVLAEARSRRPPRAKARPTPKSRQTAGGSPRKSLTKQPGPSF